MLNHDFAAKNIPSFFSLLKLVSGLFVITFALQDSKGLILAGYALFSSILFDFLKDFPLKHTAALPENNKNLNALIDMVCFAVAPSVILYILLKTDLQIQKISLSLPAIKIIALLLPWIFTFSFAISLSKNLSSARKPLASGIKPHIIVMFIASLPLMTIFDPYNLILFPQLGKSTYFFFGAAVLSAVLTNSYVISFLCIALAYFISVKAPMFSLKFHNFKFKENRLKYFFLIISSILFLTMQLIAIPFIFITYLTFSFFNNRLNKKLQKLSIQ